MMAGDYSFVGRAAVDLAKQKALGKVFRIGNFLGIGGGKKRLPRLDSTGKVHGEPKEGVQKRIEVTSQMGRDKPHGQRQGTEQNLIKSIEKYLEDN